MHHLLIKFQPNYKTNNQTNPNAKAATPLLNLTPRLPPEATVAVALAVAFTLPVTKIVELPAAYFALDTGASGGAGVLLSSPPSAVAVA